MIGIFCLLITKNMLTNKCYNAIVNKRPSAVAKLWCRDSFFFFLSYVHCLFGRQFFVKLLHLCEIKE